MIGVVFLFHFSSDTFRRIGLVVTKGVAGSRLFHRDGKIFLSYFLLDFSLAISFPVEYFRKGENIE